MSEELTYRYKRLNELDEIFELTHSYGDDYPVIINRALDEIINNEIELNQLKDRINKAVEILNNENESCQGALTNPEHTIVSKHQLLKNDINIMKKLIDLLKGDKE